jgi:hypothetical protein
MRVSLAVTQAKRSRFLRAHRFEADELTMLILMRHLFQSPDIRIQNHALARSVFTCG